MKSKELLKLVDKLCKQIKIDFGKERCDGFSLDCSICKSNILVDLLMWYREDCEQE